MSSIPSRRKSQRKAVKKAVEMNGNVMAVFYVHEEEDFEITLKNL